MVCSGSSASSLARPNRSSNNASSDTATMLYIDPSECIDCDACVEACPVDATMAEDDIPAQWEVFKEINRAYYEQGHEAGEKMVQEFLAARG